MNTKYYFVYGKKSGNQLTKAVRYRRVAVRVCARMNGVILPGNKNKKAVEAMPLPLFPDYVETAPTRGAERRKNQYAVGYIRSIDCMNVLVVWPPKVSLDSELVPDGLGWKVRATINPI
jgi:hypothetical protein